MRITTAVVCSALAACYAAVEPDQPATFLAGNACLPPRTAYLLRYEEVEGDCPALREGMVTTDARGSVEAAPGCLQGANAGAEGCVSRVEVVCPAFTSQGWVRMEERGQVSWSPDGSLGEGESVARMTQPSGWVCVGRYRVTARRL